MDKAMLTQEIERHRTTIATLRDELRLKMHLASMDAKVAFQELEHKAEHLSREVSEASHRGLVEVKKRLEQLAESLRQPTSI